MTRAALQQPTHTRATLSAQRGDEDPQNGEGALQAGLPGRSRHALANWPGNKMGYYFLEGAVHRWSYHPCRTGTNIQRRGKKQRQTKNYQLWWEWTR